MTTTATTTPTELAALREDWKNGPGLVPEQMKRLSLLEALDNVYTVARANGRDWKYKLSYAWATGRYWELKSIASNSDAACGRLQGLRNSPNYGPGSRFWETVKANLAGLEWKDEAGAKQYHQATPKSE